MGEKLLDDALEVAAENVRAHWLEWEQEAGEISQRVQSSMAGEQYLHAAIRAGISEAMTEVRTALAKGV